MKAKEEIKKIVEFSELFSGNESKSYSKFDRKGGYKLWREMNEAEREESRNKWYRDELDRWQGYVGINYIEDEDFDRSRYAFEEDEKEESVYWKFGSTDNDITNKFRYFKQRYIRERNYVDWVHFKLENEIAILENRRNTELKKKWYKRRDGKKGAYVERRFWKPCKGDMRYCEIFFTYGRNQRYDLIDNNRLVLKVENKKSVVLKTLRLLYKHYFETVAFDIEVLYVEKLKNDLKGKVRRKLDLYEVIHCVNDEKIGSYIDVVKYKKRSDLIQKIYKSSYMFIVLSAKWRGEDIFSTFEWDEEKEEWKCNKVYKHLIREEGEKDYRKPSKWDRFFNEQEEFKRKDTGFSSEDIDDLFKDI